MEIAPPIDRENGCVWGALAADQRADGHARMAQACRIAYAKTPRESMANHCKMLEKNYREAASEYRKLAEEHHKMAAKAN